MSPLPEPLVATPSATPTAPAASGPARAPAGAPAPPRRVAPMRTEYGELLTELRAAGLMRRRLGWYARTAALLAAALAAAVVGFVLVGDSWWTLLLAPVFAVLFTHSGFLGHDAGHGQIVGSRRRDDVIGYIAGDLVVGLGYGWWTGKHNAHHAHPNDAEHDPDVDIPILAFSARQAGEKSGFAAFVVRHQAVLFGPLLLLEALSLHLSSIRSVIVGEVRRPRMEGALLLAHAVLYLGGVLLVLSPLRALAFVVVHQALFGLYLGLSFAPNHKGLAMPEPGEKLDPVRRQVLTSRNIRGSRAVDTLLGGLNHQIEHHLFPRLPRPHLPLAVPIVRAFCERHDLPYTVTSLGGSYAQTLRHLHAAGAPLRAPAA